MHNNVVSLINAKCLNKPQNHPSFGALTYLPRVVQEEAIGGHRPSSIGVRCARQRETMRQVCLPLRHRAQMSWLLVVSDAVRRPHSLPLTLMELTMSDRAYHVRGFLEHSSSVSESYPLLLSIDVFSNRHSRPRELASDPLHHAARTVPSDLSFVLSASSLAVAPLPTTTSSLTITNPDAPPTTLPLVSGSSTSPVTAQPLPSELPSGIFPPTPLDLNQVTSQYTMISILFNEELNWPFL